MVLKTSDFLGRLRLDDKVRILVIVVLVATVFIGRRDRLGRLGIGLRLLHGRVATHLGRSRVGVVVVTVVFVGVGSFAASGLGLVVGSVWSIRARSRQSICC